MSLHRGREGRLRAQSPLWCQEDIWVFASALHTSFHGRLASLWLKTYTERDIQASCGSALPASEIKTKSTAISAPLKCSLGPSGRSRPWGLEASHHLILREATALFAAVVQQVDIEVCQEFVTGLTEAPLWAPYLCCLRVCFCLAVIPVNELVTCISRSVPRYFCSPTVSYLLRFFSLLHSVHVFLFHGSVCLRSLWMEITDAGRCSQGQSCSRPFFFFPFPFFFNLRADKQASGHVWGFQTPVRARGPWRSTPP